jgi:NTE family protein
MTLDISLALSGGGARGFAHIGVIRLLEHEGFRIRAVAGTSAGGVIAALYAAGYTPAQMEELLARADHKKFFRRSAKEGPSILGLAGAARLLEEYLGRRTFADLKIPCAVAAVDIQSAQEVVLDEGSVVEAVLATIAVPAVLPPRLIGDRQLVDGAGMNPVPVALARSMAPRLPVAAVVLSPQVGQDVNPLPMHTGRHYPGSLLKGLGRLRLVQALNVYIHSADATDRILTELRLRTEHPEAIIRPAVGGIGILDKVDVHHLVRLGEKAATEALPALRQALTWPNRLRRLLFPWKGYPLLSS